MKSSKTEAFEDTLDECEHTFAKVLKTLQYSTKSFTKEKCKHGECTRTDSFGSIFVIRLITVTGLTPMLFPSFYRFCSKLEQYVRIVFIHQYQVRAKTDNMNGATVNGSSLLIFI